jgi:LmbE family N-acetylglucosaminyl deacetylase
MLKRIVLFLFFILHSSFFITNAQPPRSYTSSEILLQLKKLNTVGSVLYIAAHPDDENTRLIAYLANEKCLRTGYLSLTRGDGGQNLIGPEQGIELGVIRTQELLAARRIDGGEQFFTRAYDFGFSKSPEETLQKWNKDSILSDMVWVIRNFRPDIIITRFATDGSGGHGHHTTSAILAEEAFDAAADPNRFPEQLQYVSVWKTRRLFYNSTARYFNPNADLSKLIKLDVGGYNPLLGKSYGEIAAESRSMHKSQGFGSAKQRGENFEYFKPVKGDTAGLKDIFDGIDFSWKRTVGGAKVGDMITKIIKEYKVENPNQSVESFSKVMTELQKMNGIVYIHKMILANNLYSNLKGFVIDATVSEPNISLGSKQKLSLAIVSRKNETSKIKSLQFAGNLVNSFNPFDTTLNITLKKNELISCSFNSVYGKDNTISQPYYLQKPIKNSMFETSELFSKSSPEVFFNSSGTLLLHDQLIPFQFQYKWVDPEKGEQYRPVVITPPVMINVAEDVLVFDGSGKQKTLKVTVKSGKDSVSGILKFTSPNQLNTKIVVEEDKINPQFALAKLTSFNISPLAYNFQLDKKGQEKEFVFYIDAPTQSTNQFINLSAIVDGQTYTKGIKEIKYDHIPIQTLFPEAEVKLVKLDLAKKSKRIGYIPGAGDEVQACLSQLGYEVITLSDDKLASENLSQYDAILTGVRAYNTKEKLPSFKQKLMEYVSSGGNLIVQYNTNSWAGPLSSDIGPYKFKITRNRITDETAKVDFLLPNHPILNSPNKITEKDFEGWIQERSIYHAGEWDSNYVAPISMTDPFEMTIGGVSPKGNPDNGALIIAKHGKGNFIYSGLVFFRELPAGVPGAYRLMVNLIELGK